MRCFGFLIMLAGCGVTLVSFFADDLGLGEFAGFGQAHYQLAIVGLVVAAAGVLLVIAPRSR
ncbi:MAG: hypothetical protein ACKVWV_17565 [Planctomycetota bacterium]